MNYEAYTVEELIEATTDLNDRVDTLFDRLGHIECTASGDGIEATVNLEGRLINLTLSAEAVTLPPDTLAAEIFRLTQEASAEALTQGLAALPPIAGEPLTANLTKELTAPPPTPTPPPTANPTANPTNPPADPTAAPTNLATTRPTPHPQPTLDNTEDFSTIQTWSVH